MEHPIAVPTAPTWPLLAAPRPVVERPGAVGVRIGDAEREAAQAELAEHYTAGRLTLEEYLHRVDAAAVATMRSELVVLTADLPRTPSALPAVAASPVPPAGATASAPVALFHPVVLADVFFGILGPLAAFCLLVLLVAAGTDEAFFGCLGALGGAVSFGAVVHFAHRWPGRAARRP